MHKLNQTAPTEAQRAPAVTPQAAAHPGAAPQTVQRGEQLYEGKAKRVYATDSPDYVIFEYKDDATAFNGQKHAQISGKGELNTAISTAIFERLAAVGVSSHFVRRLGPNEQLCRRVQIIPLEVIVRNRAAGSMAKRLGLEEGAPLHATVLELSFKDDALGDPLISEYHAVALGLVSFAEVEAIWRAARRVNAELRAAFAAAGMELVDFKIEFGRDPALPPGPQNIILADEISPDTCRLWDMQTGERLDKDRFRRDLGPLLDGYREVLRRLGAAPTSEAKPASEAKVADESKPTATSPALSPAHDKMHEECGVFGVFCPTDVDAAVQARLSRLVYYGLYALQHRGQESAGMVVNNTGEFVQHRGMGLVAEVFSDRVLEGLVGHAAVGHVRYSTAGSSNITNAQPLLAATRLGQVAIAHNGNLVNAAIIRDLLEDAGVTFQTTSDSEVILNLIARGAKYGLEKSLLDAMRAIQGSFSLVILTNESLIAVRDPKGIRPLCLGQLEEGHYVVASESCSLDAVAARFVRDVEPGEIVIIDETGIRSLKQHERTERRVCSFEYVYFSRPDSVVDEVSVYESRLEAGRILFQESPVDADVVSGVPDSGVVAAHGFAEAAGLTFAMTLIKNKYVGRSFIAPTQELRERAVGVKLNVLRSTVAGKRVVLIDDSIVRGTTMRRLVSMLRRAGAAEVHIRIASPPVKYPCYFGMDYPSREELAGSRSVEEVCSAIGADSLAYLSIEGLHRALGGSRRFCMGCLTGVYPVAAPVEQEKDHLEPAGAAKGSF